MGRFTKYNANLSLLVPYPVPTFRFVFEPISLGVIDGNFCRLVNDDIPAVTHYGDPVLTILHLFHFCS